MENITAKEILDAQSLQTLNLQVPALVCWFILGTVSIISNVSIAITIAKSKTLHSKFMASLASLAIADLCSGIFFMVQGAKKLVLVAMAVPETSTQLSCLLQMVPGIWALTVSDTMTLSLSVDRLLAMALPIAYATRLRTNYVVFLNVLAWTAATTFSASAFYVEDSTKLFHVCYAVVTPDVWYQNLVSNVRVGLGVSNLILFSATLLFLWRRFRKSKALPSEERRRVRQGMEINMVRTLGVILIVYLLLKWASSVLLTSLFTLLSPTMHITVTPFNALLPCAYSMSHFFVYFSMSAVFRKAFFRVILRRLENSVVRVEPAGFGGNTGSGARARW